MSDITRLSHRTPAVPTTQTQLIKLMRERESQRQSQQQQHHTAQDRGDEAQDETSFHIDEYA
jgi:hypothetical protein